MQLNQHSNSCLHLGDLQGFLLFPYGEWSLTQQMSSVPTFWCVWMYLIAMLREEDNLDRVCTQKYVRYVPSSKWIVFVPELGYETNYIKMYTNQVDSCMEQKLNHYKITKNSLIYNSISGDLMGIFKCFFSSFQNAKVVYHCCPSPAGNLPSKQL